MPPPPLRMSCRRRAPAPGEIHTIAVGDGAGRARERRARDAVNVVRNPLAAAATQCSYSRRLNTVDCTVSHDRRPPSPPSIRPAARRRCLRDFYYRRTCVMPLSPKQHPTLRASPPSSKRSLVYTPSLPGSWFYSVCIFSMKSIKKISGVSLKFVSRFRELKFKVCMFCDYFDFNVIFGF